MWADFKFLGEMGPYLQSRSCYHRVKVDRKLHRDPDHLLSRSVSAALRERAESELELKANSWISASMEVSTLCDLGCVLEHPK